MKGLALSISESIASRYREWSPAIFCYFLVSMVMILLYRVRILTMIGQSYAEYRPMGLWDFFSISGRDDALAALVILGVLTALFMTAGKYRKTGLVLASLFTLAQCVGLLLGMDFFRVYETTFQKSFWTDENDSAGIELFFSIMSETTLRFWIFFLLLTVILLVLYRFLSRTYGDDSIPSAMNRFPATRMSRAAMAFPVMAAFFLLVIALGTGGQTKIDTISARFPGADRAKSALSLQEFAMNPLYNLLFEKPVSTRKTQGDDSTAGEPGHFSFRFNTDSIQAREMYNDMGIIPRGRKYNIVLYFFESTAARYLDLEINGRPVTPTWRRMRENSINAVNHYANFPLSANALLSILTSAYSHPSKDLVIQKHSGIGIASLPQILKEKGYRTCIIHPGDLRYAGQKRFLKYRSFDRIIDYNDMKDIPPYNYKVGWGLDERSMTDPSVAFMKENRKDPFFMVYMPVNPHHPYAIPGEEFRITGNIPSGADYKKKNWLNYINSLHYADACLGSLVDRLEKEGLMENTLFFLFADHGEAFYQHPKNYNHPFFLYEDNVHVPFLVYNRDLIDRAHYHRGITRHIDIMPSILDILDIQGPPEQEGISIFGRHRAQMALLHTYWKDDYMAVRDESWKYIRRMHDGFEELYDIDEDPMEKTNLAGSQREVTETYRSVVLKGRRHAEKFYDIMLKERKSLAVKEK